MKCGDVNDEDDDNKEIVYVNKANAKDLTDLHDAKDLVLSFAPVRGTGEITREVVKTEADKKLYNASVSKMMTVGEHFHNNEYRLSANSLHPHQQNQLKQRANEAYGSVRRICREYFALPMCDIRGDSARSYIQAGSSGLTNETHIDPGDSSPSTSLWLKHSKGEVQCWFFLLPQFKIKIKLSHGTMISWDGRTLRHGSISQDSEGYNVPDCVALCLGTKYTHTSQFNIVTQLRNLLDSKIRECNDEWQMGVNGKLERKDKELFHGCNERKNELLRTRFFFLTCSRADKENPNITVKWGKVKITRIKKLEGKEAGESNFDNLYTIKFCGSSHVVDIRSSRFLIKEETFDKYMLKKNMLTTQNRHMLSK